MRMIKHVSLCLAALMIFFSCKKETSVEVGDELPIEGKWEFKVPGESYQGPLDSAYIYNYGPYQELFLIGSAPDVKGELIIRAIGLEITPGSYKNPAALFIYGEDGIPLFMNDPSIEDEFTITITSLDSVSISGTFSGKVLDGQGNEKMLTDGKFTAMLTKGVEQPPQIVLGQLTLWSKNVCPGEGIEITIGDQSGFITQALDSEPSCGGDGTITIVLPVGHYTFKATCGDKTADYEVDITENQCTVMEIGLANFPVFTDYFPDMEGLNWVYQDAANTAETATTVSSEIEQINDIPYHKFTDLSGKTRYYRKNNNEYYEYGTPDYGGVTDAPTIEYVFLKDNAPENTSWETAVFDLTVAQIRVKGKLRFTITGKDFSRPIGGKSYDNLIEVFTEMLISINGGVSFTTAGFYTTVYAKGIGVVYAEIPKPYPDPNTQWEIKNYFLNP
ncbi:MAG: hypothetical protein JNL51_00560 [Chitinophagaceae bacterium]|nr:hypothetical protein [Chitinophagaceae bacterium]